MNMLGNIFFLFVIISYILNIIDTCPVSCECKSINNVVCKRKSLNSIPTNIPIEVTYLDLSFNSIKILPADVFIKFQKLKCLKLAHNNMKTIDQNAFRGLINLKDLYLEHNDLSYLQPEMFSVGFDRLLHLYLGNNEFEQIPILKASKMTKLNLDSNRINSAFINEAFLLNTELKTIVLTKNNIKTINKNDFINLKNTQLISLMLKFNNLEYIHPEAFSHVKDSLQNLELEGNKLLNSSVIEYSLKGFEGGSGAMIYLDLQNCGLKSISANFFKPFFESKLHQLVISHNSLLKEVDENAFVGLKRLMILKMTNCKVSSPNIRFSVMNELKQLYLSHNNFTRSPYRFPGSLEIIDLRSNNIRTILRNDFKSLSALKELYLTSNAILSIEKNSFTDLSQLKILDLGFNRLKQIETEIFVRMPELVSLSLKMQKPCIETIHTDALDLSHLQSLDLEGNCIVFQQAQPSILKNLPMLRNISLSGNRLIHLYDSLFKGCNMLENVDLSNNEITDWSPLTFVPLKASLVKLELSVNKISFVSVDSNIDNYLPADFQALKTIFLINNVWNCTCRNVIWMVKFKTIIKDPDNIICQKPVQYSGKKLLDIMANCSNEIPLYFHPLIHTSRISNSTSSNLSRRFNIILTIIFLTPVLIFIGLAFYYRKKIRCNKLMNGNKRYTRFQDLEDQPNVFSNNLIQDQDEDVIAPNEDCRLQLRSTTEMDDSNDEEYNPDVVFVTRNSHKCLRHNEILEVLQIHELISRPSRRAVLKCPKLAIDYPPPDLDILTTILDQRPGSKMNYIFVDYNKSSELENSEFSHANCHSAPLHYDADNLVKQLTKII